MATSQGGWMGTVQAVTGAGQRGALWVSTNGTFDRVVVMVGFEMAAAGEKQIAVVW